MLQLCPHLVLSLHQFHPSQPSVHLFLNIPSIFPLATVNRLCRVEKSRTSRLVILFFVTNPYTRRNSRHSLIIILPFSSHSIPDFYDDDDRSWCYLRGAIGSLCIPQISRELRLRKCNWTGDSINWKRFRIKQQPPPATELADKEDNTRPDHLSISTLPKRRPIRESSFLYPLTRAPGILQQTFDRDKPQIQYQGDSLSGFVWSFIHSSQQHITQYPQHAHPSRPNT